MTGREWQPGDVAMVECSDGQYRRAAYRRARVGNPEAWEFEDGACWRVNESRTRPLVVIDPEDREQVERLSLAMRMPLTLSLPDADRLQAALREFANPTPPKPAEPTGLGAVVEDAEGERWVRTDPDAPAWTKWDASLTRLSYANVTAVRVLSEGVTS